MKKSNRITIIHPNFKGYICLLFIALLAITACKKSSGPTPKKTTPAAADVYVVGSTGSNSGSATVATYWKNGVAKQLEDGSIASHLSQANAITIQGSDVYIAGYISNPPNDVTSGYNIACYWKNGTITKLTDGLSGGSYAYAIAVNGNDVYVAGTFNYYPAYWKNGVLVKLNDIQYGGSTTAIALNGTDIYVAGYSLSGNATYWKNGIATVPGGAGSTANSMALNGNDVYLAGYTGYDASKSIATYWKNGVATNLTDGSGYANAVALAVIGADVYIAGNIIDPATGNYIPTYWKNGIATKFTDGSPNDYAYAMAVNGTDVYVAGQIGTLAAYWKNGAVVQLPLVGDGTAWGYSIAVVTH